MATTSALTPKQVVRRYLKAMTHGKPGDLAKLVAPNIVAVQGGERLQGAAAAEAYAAYYRAAFSGWSFEVTRMVAEGSWVAVYGVSIGTVRAALPNGVKAGTAARIPWMAQYRVARGRVAEVHIVADTTALAEPARAVRVPLAP